MRKFMLAGLLAGALMTAGTASASMAQAASVPNTAGSDCSANGHAFNPTGSSNGIPVFAITSGYGCLNGIHKCADLGKPALNTANGHMIQGVECTDLYAAEPGIQVSPVASAYCQDLSNHDALVQCANIDITFEMANPDNTWSFSYLQCGHSLGACGSGRLYYPGAQQVETSKSCLSGSPNEWWTVDLSGGTIELPGSDKTVTSGSNLASGHAVVCP